MTSNFTAAELRNMACGPCDNPTMVGSGEIGFYPESCGKCWQCKRDGAIREYAALKEAAEKGVTDEVVEIALSTWDINWRSSEIDGINLRDMRAALLAVAPLLALTNGAPMTTDTTHITKEGLLQAVKELGTGPALYEPGVMDWILARAAELSAQESKPRI